MARFLGNVGFGENVLKSPGVYEDVITTRRYKGDVVRNTRSFQQDEEISGNVTVSHSISVVADEYAIAHLQEIRFVEWDGGFWVVTTVQRERPRLILGLGGVYNGPTS